MPDKKLGDLTLGTAAQLAASAGVPFSGGANQPAKLATRDVLRDAILNASEEARFGGTSIFSPRNAVVCLAGDSNTCGRPAFRQAYLADWFGVGGIYEGGTHYNCGTNGATLDAWIATIASGDQNEAPVDKADVDGGLNIWQIVNARPNDVHFQIGTNNFRVNAGPGLLSAVASAFQANLKVLIDFILLHTNARLILSIPHPIAFANPDPQTGFTDCVDATDAADRSAAMRAAHLVYANYSARVIVWDSHKHLFGYRADTVGACDDPEGFGDLLDDTLHTSGLGGARKVQYLGRALRPSQPATSSYFELPLAIASDAFWSAPVYVNEGGNGYMYVAQDFQALQGSLSRSLARPCTKNTEIANAIAAAGAGHPIAQLRKLGKRWKLYCHSTGATVTVTSGFNAINYRSGNLDFELLATADFTGVSGVCTIYVDDVTCAPTLLRETLPRYLSINGPQPLTVGAEGRSVPGFRETNVQTLLTVDGTCSGAGVSVDVTLYVQNTVDGRYVDGIVGTIANPGKPIGVLNFPAGYKNGPTWTWDATYYPSGGFVFDNPVVAKITTGTAGASCELALVFA